MEGREALFPGRQVLGGTPWLLPLVLRPQAQAGSV